MNTQSLSTECCICIRQYGTAPSFEPRVLRCGHTFCTECIEKLCSGSAEASSNISCPLCALPTNVPFHDVRKLPVNYSILDIQSSNKAVHHSEVICEYCCEKEATIVCFNCSVIGVRFCSDCDRVEHDRPFKPAQLHRRIPLDEVNMFASCSTHEGCQATMFSELHDKFACHECELQPDWLTLSSTFLPIEVAAAKQRRQIGNMNRHCTKELNKVYVASGEVENALSTLHQSSSLARQEIQQEFATLRALLAEREKDLLTTLTEEYQVKKERLLQQKQQLIDQAKHLSYSSEELKNLLEANDISFLKVCRNVREQMYHFLSADRVHILSLLAPPNIPVFFSGDLKSEITNYGIMGGGPQPLKLTAQRLHNLQDSTLLQLSWALPAKAPSVTQYEIEYESIVEGFSNSPTHSGEVAVLRKPQHVLKSGKAQAHIINDLYPNHRYRFRVRSSSIAGWGVWSDCVVTRFPNFPLKISFIGEKVSFCIPEDGMYSITAAGAKAADGKFTKGGTGAIVSFHYWLQQHNRIEVVVGGMSECDQIRGNSGGGGGTFVVLCGTSQQVTIDNLLVAAGGGGGTRGMEENSIAGCDASLEPSGTNGRGDYCGIGGENGLQGGEAGSPLYGIPCWGYGGAGFLMGSVETGRAKSYLNGSEGGQCGGFGGGGGVGIGGGGGGGFSGGGGGVGGGGGGTYVKNTAINIEKKVGNTDHGYVIIKQVSGVNSLITPTNSRRGSSSPVSSPPLTRHVASTSPQ